MLKTPEWKALDNGDLEIFHQALLNHIAIFKSDIYEIARIFASWWVWVWSFASKADELPVDFASFDPAKVQCFIDTFKKLETNNQTATFCAQVFQKVLKVKPDIVTAVVNTTSNPKWYDPTENVDWQPSSMFPSFFDPNLGTTTPLVFFYRGSQPVPRDR